MVEEPSVLEKGTLPNGLGWICGSVSLGKTSVSIDSRTGKGMQEVLDGLKKFISYQSVKSKFPNMGIDDVAQELNLLALEAIPKYNNTKNANMLTFLQGHIKNRLINKCKFVSEKKRRATFFNLTACKFRCPNCHNFFVSKLEYIECPKCGAVSDDKQAKWKQYNLPILPILFSMLDSRLPDDTTSIADLLPDTQNFAVLAGKTDFDAEQVFRYRLDFEKIMAGFDDINKAIVKMLIEGHAYRDIANKLGISEKVIHVRVNKILQNTD